jgi:alkylation response protein AidB-like acyl-CoA dehydrogenase
MLIDDIRARLPTLFERDARDPDEYPGENVADLFALGVIAAPLPKALGGGGTTLEQAVTLVEAIALASPSTALLASQTLSGPAGVSAFGTSIALRPDATELAESGDMPPHVTIYAPH